VPARTQVLAHAAVLDFTGLRSLKPSMERVEHHAVVICHQPANAVIWATLAWARIFQQIPKYRAIGFAPPV